MEWRKCFNMIHLLSCFICYAICYEVGFFFKLLSLFWFSPYSRAEIINFVIKKFGSYVHKHNRSNTTTFSVQITE